MNLQQCYQILKLPPDASDENISSAYRRLALNFHPDKNRNRQDWANVEMSRLNLAYDTILSHRFKNKKPEDTKTQNDAQTRAKESGTGQGRQKAREEVLHPEQEIIRENLVRSFIQFKDFAKDALYRFFQYNLSNIARRESSSNRGIYNRIVMDLRKSYHGIKQLSSKTNDKELLEHFSVFMNMIFNFYRAAECLNVIDNYNSQYEIEAYRSYHNGDEALFRCQKELFYDRHNRGFYKNDLVVSSLVEAGQYLQGTVKYFPQSTWKVEAEIKYAFTKSLMDYVSLFFSEE